jgi:hypothetical protein
MSEQWPVPGHSFWYTTEIVLDDGYRLTFDLTLPKAIPELNLTTVRLGRHGGESNADRMFQQRLYVRIGAVAVAGGHVETAMKRLLLLLKGEAGQFSLVDKTWSELHKALSQECSGSKLDSRRKRLKRVLAWGEDKQVKRRRDNVVHAYWWNVDGCGVRRSRFYRHEDGVTIISSLEDLTEDADLLFEYARRLDDLLGEDWARAMLPSEGQSKDRPSTDA